MEDVEIQESHYWKGGLNYRHGQQRLLQRLHQGSKGINGPPNDHRGTQRVQITEDPQVFQEGNHLVYCIPK